MDKKLSTALCPTSARAVKITNKYISLLFKARKRIDNGDHVSNFTFPPTIDPYCWESLEVTSESELSDAESSVSSLECMSSSFTSMSD